MDKLNCASNICIIYELTNESRYGNKNIWPKNRRANFCLKPDNKKFYLSLSFYILANILLQAVYLADKVYV